ncbi:MAG: D-isomer specific 2-hydroxyacid dehydrogenase NAD-binding protein [Clostridia bacterium 41_269]|nr:MAG: D-isomer specific 2-hydroxyacid dehydrogenase NAD-binding protein [Clostridia bacterium 41_269]
MAYDLTGITLAVLGGDERELIFIPELVKLGAKVNVVGFDKKVLLKEAIHYNSVEEAVEEVDAAVMPMPGTDEEGRIRAIYSTESLTFTKEAAEKLAGKHLFIGVAKSYIKKLCAFYNISLIEVAKLDEFAILNSIPTAEGAIQIAMQETPHTIHNSCCFILGYGRVGTTLTRMLHSIGAKTFVVSKDDAELARAFEQGSSVVKLEDLPQKINQAHIIFNTIPARVLDSAVLEAVNRDSLIIDLVSTPAGTNFELAEKLGIKAILAPGLPGKVAPKTAGEILAQILPKLIYQYVV